MELADSPIVRIAEKWKHVHQMMLLCKLCIRALCKMISGGVVLCIIGLRYVAKTGGMLRILLAILFAHFLKDLVDQPHVKASIQVENLSQPHKSGHKQICDKLLQFFCWRVIREQRIHGKNNDSAINGQGMAGFFSAVVRKCFQVAILLASGRLPEGLAVCFSVPRFQPGFYLCTKFGHIT